MMLRFTTIFIAALALSTGASGQNSSKTTPAACPAPATITVLHLYGEWRAEIGGQPGVARVQLQKDPAQDDSLVGSIARVAPTAKPALLAGDVQAGDFQLEESDDGVRISATWSGQVVDASCGKEIKGLWTNALTDQTQPFTLRRAGGWQ